MSTPKSGRRQEGQARGLNTISSLCSFEHLPKEAGGFLGSYNSSLTAAYYQQLLDLLDKAISSGDLSGGSAFDKSSLLKLEAQAQSFASLPLGSAGNRVMDDSFNYPLSLLDARLKALAAEAGNFTTVSGRLLDILRNETWSLSFLGPSRHLSKKLPLRSSKRPRGPRPYWPEEVLGSGRKKG